MPCGTEMIARLLGSMLTKSVPDPFKLAHNYPHIQCKYNLRNIPKITFLYPSAVRHLVALNLEEPLVAFYTIQGPGKGDWNMSPCYRVSNSEDFRKLIIDGNHKL